MPRGMTGAMGLPHRCAPGRNGDVQLPALWAGDADGCLRASRVAASRRRACRSRATAATTRVTGGFVLADTPAADAPLVVPAGTRTATWSWQ